MMKKTTRNYLGILLANVLLVAFVGVVWQVKLEAATPVKPVLQGVFEHVKIEKTLKTAPESTYLEGFKKSVPLSALKGDWVILNLWATWCAPCVTELPSLQKLSDSYKGKGLRVVAISLDDVQNVEELKGLMARAKLSGISVAKNWDDKGEVASNLWPEAVPATYILSPEGKIFATFEGDADWAGPDAKAFVDSLLKASK